MSRLVDSLKELSKKTNTSGKVAEGNTVDKVLENLADNFNLSGTAGATITAINLVLNSSGVLSSGTCTLSDGSVVNITITTA